jgi:NitT/TauT family transport system substrate-binding protein
MLLCFFAASPAPAQEPAAPAGRAPESPVPVGQDSASHDPVRLKIGLLPVADTILITAAAERGFFARMGLQVELVNFQSALDKDAAAIAGTLDGHFCEIISVIVQQASGRDFKVAAVTSSTSPEMRMFGLVTSPDSAGLDLAGMRGRTLLTARQTITDFLADMFWRARGLPEDFMVRRDVRKIPVRMQLLVSGQGDASLVPEPMLSVAERAGGRLLMDDRELPEMPLAVVALNGRFPPRVFTAFRDALGMSVAWVNAEPAAAKALMVERGLVPPELSEVYRLPVFDPARIPMRLPEPGLYRDYVRYLQRLGTLAGGPDDEGTGLPVPGYSDVVRALGRR